MWRKPGEKSRRSSAREQGEGGFWSRAAGARQVKEKYVRSFGERGFKPMCTRSIFNDWDKNSTRQKMKQAHPHKGYLDLHRSRNPSKMKNVMRVTLEIG